MYLKILIIWKIVLDAGGPFARSAGEHLVDGKGGPEGKLGQFVDDVLGAQ